MCCQARLCPAARLMGSCIAVRWIARPVGDRDQIDRAQVVVGLPSARLVACASVALETFKLHICYLLLYPLHRDSGFSLRRGSHYCPFELLTLPLQSARTTGSTTASSFDNSEGASYSRQRHSESERARESV
ncbi:unnamed protein product [Protopolystoma xenopodis]|uniref:Uncharacterized protein n=1 Tax=Protopolystoma xenopodis TaxID=117903 RepID=A0A448WG68_9PLAT|nr:unnamed protein product [Protopolystoma xenopodis]